MDPRIRHERLGPHSTRTDELFRVQLTETLATGSNALAKILTPTGAAGALVLSDMEWRVYDPLSKFSGSSGDKFLARFFHDSQHLEIVGPAAGAAASDKTYGLMSNGHVTTTVDGSVQVANYKDTRSASNGVTLDTAAGEMTIVTAGLYQIRFSGRAIYIGTLGGVNGVSTDIAELSLYLNGAYVIGSGTTFDVIDGVAGYGHFAYEFAYEFDADDVLHMEYSPNDIESNGDFNNSCTTVSFYIEKIPGALAG